MKMHQTRRTRIPSFRLLSIGLLLLLALLFVAGGLHKLQYSKLPSRASWQYPDRVIETLGIEPGEYVADIGAGDGYFTFRFANSVGPSGKVYAVEVDANEVAELRSKTTKLGRSNVIVVSAQTDDPLLPDGEIDLVFLCNVYHHIENRPSYFDRLRSDLKPAGRVVIIDLRPSLLVRAFAPRDHWIVEESMLLEMASANYSLSQRYDFLPAQHFLVFCPLSFSNDPESATDLFLN
jgi:ubiquinone/menaquinone biosynthesis C-methylase UbiE